MTEPIPRFRIDGREYPIPMQDTLTMDEAILIHDYSGLTLDQVADQPGNPKLIKALVHIAYQRGNPDATHDEISKLVGAAQLASLMEIEEEAVEERPPVQSNSPSETSRSDESPSSGDGSSEPSTPSPASNGLSSSGRLGSDTPLTYDRVTLGESRLSN